MLRSIWLICKHVRIVIIHKTWVAYYIALVIVKLLSRAIFHDMSKLRIDEIRGFSKLTTGYGSCRYDSPEYKARHKVLSETLKLHYERNSHHPEHYNGDVTKMDIIDIAEMVCDWKAAVHYAHGDIKESIRIQKVKYRLEGQLLDYITSLTDISKAEAELVRLGK